MTHVMWRFALYVLTLFWNNASAGVVDTLANTVANRMTVPASVEMTCGELRDYVTTNSPACLYDTFNNQVALPFVNNSYCAPQEYFDCASAAMENFYTILNSPTEVELQLRTHTLDSGPFYAAFAPLTQRFPTACNKASAVFLRQQAISERQFADEPCKAYNRALFTITMDSVNPSMLDAYNDTYVQLAVNNTLTKSVFFEFSQYSDNGYTAADYSQSIETLVSILPETLEELSLRINGFRKIAFLTMDSEFFPQCLLLSPYDYGAVLNDAYVTPSLNLARFARLRSLTLVRLPVLNEEDLFALGNATLVNFEWFAFNSMSDPNRALRSSTLCSVTRSFNVTASPAQCNDLYAADKQFGVLAVSHYGSLLSSENNGTWCDVSDVTFDALEAITLEGYVTGVVNFVVCSAIGSISVVGCNVTVPAFSNAELDMPFLLFLQLEDLCYSSDTPVYNTLPDFTKMPNLRQFTFALGDVALNSSYAVPELVRYCEIRHATGNFQDSDAVCASFCFIFGLQGINGTALTCDETAPFGYYPANCALNVPCAACNTVESKFNDTINTMLGVLPPNTTDAVPHTMINMRTNYPVVATPSAVYAADVDAYVTDLMDSAFTVYAEPRAKQVAYSQVPLCMWNVLEVQEEWCPDIATTPQLTTELHVHNATTDDGSLTLLLALADFQQSTFNENYYFLKSVYAEDMIGTGALSGLLNSTGYAYYDPYSDSYQIDMGFYSFLYDQLTLFSMTVQPGGLLHCQWLSFAMGKNMVAVRIHGDMDTVLCYPPINTVASFAHNTEYISLRGTASGPYPLYSFKMLEFAEPRFNRLRYWDMQHVNMNGPLDEDVNDNLPHPDMHMPRGFQFMFPKLRAFRCTNCSLTGDLPDMSNMEDLSVISLADNPLLTGNVATVLNRGIVYDVLDFRNTGVTGSVTDASHLFCFVPATVCVFPVTVTLTSCTNCVHG